jgi:hypothetical protein
MFPIVWREGAGIFSVAARTSCAGDYQYSALHFSTSMSRRGTGLEALMLAGSLDTIPEVVARRQSLKHGKSEFAPGSSESVSA